MDNDNDFSQFPQHSTSVPKEKITIELLQENLLIGKQTVETATVQLNKKVHYNEQVVNIDLTSTNVEVEKIAINKIVETRPTIRYEGETMVIPILKEVLVTEKKLMLVEEWHISQTTKTDQHTETVVLREEELIANRIPAEGQK